MGIAVATVAAAAIPSSSYFVSSTCVAKYLIKILDRVKRERGKDGGRGGGENAMKTTTKKLTNFYTHKKVWWHESIVFAGSSQYVCGREKKKNKYKLSRGIYCIKVLNVVGAERITRITKLKVFPFLLFIYFSFSWTRRVFSSSITPGCCRYMTYKQQP